MSEPEDQAPFGTNLGEAIEKKIEQVNELAPDQKEIASISEQLEKLIGDIQPDTNQAELESLKAILNDSEKRISMMKKQFPVDEKLANLRMRIVAAKIKLEQREKSIKDEVTPESETVRITNWLNILDRTISAVSSNQTLSETQILLGSASAAIETVLEKFPKEQERVGSLHNLLKIVNNNLDGEKNRRAKNALESIKTRLVAVEARVSDDSSVAELNSAEASIKKCEIDIKRFRKDYSEQYESTLTDLISGIGEIKQRIDLIRQIKLSAIKNQYDIAKLLEQTKKLQEEVSGIGNKIKSLEEVTSGQQQLQPYDDTELLLQFKKLKEEFEEIKRKLTSTQSPQIDQMLLRQIKGLPEHVEKIDQRLDKVELENPTVKEVIQKLEEELEKLKNQQTLPLAIDKDEMKKNVLIVACTVIYTIGLIVVTLFGYSWYKGRSASKAELTQSPLKTVSEPGLTGALESKTNKFLPEKTTSMSVTTPNINKLKQTAEDTLIKTTITTNSVQNTVRSHGDNNIMLTVANGSINADGLESLIKKTEWPFNCKPKRREPIEPCEGTNSVGYIVFIAKTLTPSEDVRFLLPPNWGVQTFVSGVDRDMWDMNLNDSSLSKAEDDFKLTTASMVRFRNRDHTDSMKITFKCTLLEKLQ